MTNAAWRVKRLPLSEWAPLQEKFGEHQMAIGGPPELAMFMKSEPGEPESAIYITGPGIETIERFSRGGWEDTGTPQGDGLSMLVGAGDPWEYFGIAKPAH
jgi:hypothetical protein